MNDVTQTQITEQIEQTMSSIDTQSQILAQLLMLTNQVGKLQEEVVDLRSQLAREPTKMVKDSTSATISATSEVKKAKKAKKEKPEGYIKKPATAFLMWQNESFRAKFKEEHPEEPPKAVASAAGPVWKAMSEEEKAPWLAKYKIAQAVYHEATGKMTKTKEVVAVSDETPTPTPKEETKEEKKAKRAAKKAAKAAKEATKEAAKEAVNESSEDSQ
jgi:high mobility group protein B1